MLIRQDFAENVPELPPTAFLSIVMGPIAQSYCFLWERKNSENQVTMSWKDLSRYYNKNSFRTCVRKLNNHGLLSYDESNDGIHIELVGFDEITDEV